MTISLFNKIRQQDNYGTNIALNFNRKGSSHNTIMGGLLTLMGKMLIFVYALHLLHTMLDFGNDTTSMTNAIESEKSLGEVWYNETGYLPRI